MRNLYKCVKVGFSTSTFPKANRLVAKPQLFPKLLLGKTFLQTQFPQFFAKHIILHIIILLQIVGKILTSYEM